MTLSKLTEKASHMKHGHKWHTARGKRHDVIIMAMDHTLNLMKALVDFAVDESLLVACVVGLLYWLAVQNPVF